MLVAEWNGLLPDDPHVGHVICSKYDREQHRNHCDDAHRAEDRDPGNGVSAPVKYLRHLTSEAVAECIRHATAAGMFGYFRCVSYQHTTLDGRMVKRRTRDVAGQYSAIDRGDRTCS